MSLRILVTGSRDWTDVETIRQALFVALGTYTTVGPAVLVHGGCPQGGADWHADHLWREIRRRDPYWLDDPEIHYLHDFPTAKARNQHMVDLGATVCLAFAMKWASGTGQTARMARRAGIHTIDYGVDTRERK